LRSNGKSQGRGVSPHTRPPCPLTHYGNLFDGKAANAVAFSAHKGFVKRWNKNFFLKSMKCFCNKVFESPENFFQKVFWWGLGQRPKIKKMEGTPIKN